MNTPNHEIPLVPEGTLDPAAGLNDALDVIDALLCPRVLSMTLQSPPGTSADGDLYIVGAGATDDWAGHDQELARRVTQGAFWQFYAPELVNVVLNDQNGALYKYASGSWMAAADPLVVTEAGTALAATMANANQYTRFTNASAKTYTFDGNETYRIGDVYRGRNVGAGNLTITEANAFDVVPQAGGDLVIPQNGSFTVRIVAAAAADLSEP